MKANYTELLMVDICELRQKVNRRCSECRYHGRLCENFISRFNKKTGEDMKRPSEYYSLGGLDYEESEHERKSEQTGNSNHTS